MTVVTNPLLINDPVSQTITAGNLGTSPSEDALFTALAGKQSNAVTGLVRVVGTSIDGGGTSPLTGSIMYVTVPFTGTIAKWYLAADVSGSIVIDIKRSSTSIVGAGNKPTLTSAQSANAAPASWTSVVITKGDILEFNLDSITTITKCNLVLEVTVA